MKEEPNKENKPRGREGERKRGERKKGREGERGEEEREEEARKRGEGEKNRGGTKRGRKNHLNNRRGHTRGGIPCVGQGGCGRYSSIKLRISIFSQFWL